jgi:hypothetical protein
MAEPITVTCRECKFNIGSLPLSAHGTRTIQRHAPDSNCKHPPIDSCRSANEAFKKALAAARAADAKRG